MGKLVADMTPEELALARERKRAYMRVRLKDPIYREQQNRRRIERAATDPVYREKQNAENRRRHQLRMADPAWAEQRRSRLREKYRVDPAWRTEVQLRAMKYHDTVKGWSKDALRSMRKRHPVVTVSWEDIARCRIANEDRGGHCPALPRLKLKYGAGEMCDASATIDRIDPSIGYVPGNIIIVSRLANAIKTNATAADIRQVACFVARVEVASKRRLAAIETEKFLEQP